MVDERPIYELTSYERLMVVVYMLCVDVLLCSFCSQVCFPVCLFERGNSG